MKVPAMPDVYLLRGFLTDAECQACRTAMDRGVPEETEILGSVFHRDQDVRRAAAVEVAPDVLEGVERRLDAGRENVARHLGVRLGTREGAGFLRYPAGGFYRRHVDWADSAVWPGASQRKVAVVVFLNTSSAGGSAGDFAGGLLRLYPSDGPPIDVVPCAGTLVAFPATLPHEVLVVRNGVRDAVVDWFG